jgi:hypothetical protein
MNQFPENDYRDIRLGPVQNVMAVAEGIETALSFQQATGIPSWAAVAIVMVVVVTYLADTLHHIYNKHFVVGVKIECRSDGLDISEEAGQEREFRRAAGQTHIQRSADQRTGISWSLLAY